MPQLLTSASIGVFTVLLALYLSLFRDSILELIPFDIPFLASPNPILIDQKRNISYIGTLNSATKVEHYQNIFYAQDTSGPNRFAPPVRFTPTAGTVVDATKSGAWCPQFTGDILPWTSVVSNISENCLSLKIARQAGLSADAKLPVVVWWHGGGHILGSGADILYDPDGLVTQAAADGNPLIFVSINYRLGIFGFAIGEALIEAKHTNAGLKDQRAALEWIQDNIEAFGGDPSRVTVMGQSCGAIDIVLNLVSYGGTRPIPFHKGIMLSGAAGTNFNTMSDFVANNTNAVAAHVGCAKLGESQTAATVECLRQADWEALTKISITNMRRDRPPLGETYFAPTYDGDILPGRPSELMRQGKVIPDIPIMASWSTNDGAWYADPAMQTDQEVLNSVALTLFGLSEATKQHLLTLYPLSDFEHMPRPPNRGSSQYYRAAQINRDFWFTCPVLDFMWQYRKHNPRVFTTNATRYTPYLEQMGIQFWRVPHLSEIPHVLNNQIIGDTSRKMLGLSKHMSRQIAAFVSSGEPEISDWKPAFEGDDHDKLNLMVFGGPHGSKLHSVTREDREGGDEGERALAWEKFLQRCEFINSAKVREEVST